MDDDATTVADMKKVVAEFNRKREWGIFHSPKNLAMSIAIEAAELMEIFQWVDADESRSLSRQIDTLEKMKDEIADILAYCLDMANVTGIDLAAAFSEKMDKNNLKYPVDKARGSAKKYTEL